MCIFAIGAGRVSNFFASLRAFFCGVRAPKAAVFGLQRNCDSGKDHQMQLFMRGAKDAYYYEIRQMYAPNGRIVRSCVLDTGTVQVSRSIALKAGNESMNRLMK